MSNQAIYDEGLSTKLPMVADDNRTKLRTRQGHWGDTASGSRRGLGESRLTLSREKVTCQSGWEHSTGCLDELLQAGGLN